MSTSPKGLSQVQTRLDRLVEIRLEDGFSGPQLAEYQELVHLERDLLRERELAAGD